MQFFLDSHRIPVYKFLFDGLLWHTIDLHKVDIAEMVLWVVSPNNQILDIFGFAAEHLRHLNHEKMYMVEESVVIKSGETGKILFWNRGSVGS